MRGPILSALLHAALLVAALAASLPGARRGPLGVTVRFAVAEDPNPVQREEFDADVPPPLPLPDLVVVETPDEAPLPAEIPALLPSAEPPADLRVPGVALRGPIRLRPPVPPSHSAAPAAPPIAAPAPKGPTRGATLLKRAVIAPAYPRTALERGYEGRVLLRVRVGADGGAKEVAVKESSGHAILDDAAVRVARKWTFEPALRDGSPVEAWYEQAVRFALSS